jgi:ABC-type glycerol-3-phosphate transport system permease component
VCSHRFASVPSEGTPSVRRSRYANRDSTATGPGVSPRVLDRQAGSGPSATLTAAFGPAVTYLLDRQRFAGKRAFEFIAMLNFAVPGTVVRIAYVIAINALEITSTRKHS